MIDTPSRLGRAWHTESVETVLSELGTDAERGLADGESERRLTADGPNLLSADGGPSPVRLFLGQFNDVLSWLLLAAAAVSGILLGDWLESGVILAIVILNAAIGFYQEYQAESALAALRDMAAPEALVVRGGDERRVPAAGIVVGDLIVLEAGDRIPADARLVSEIHMAADEAPLTGESFPVNKQIAPVGEEASTGDRRSMVFAGTSVSSGRGKAVVVATGQHTEVGRIAEMLSEEQPASPLTVELERIGRRLAVLTVVIAIVIFGLGVLREYPVETMFLSAVALAVAAIPEGLPAVVTVTLARGVQAMARKKAIVRRLPAVEALGSASVICTDKTGTLTRNEMRVQEVAFADLRATPGSLATGDVRAARLAEVAALCNDSRKTRDGFEGDPTEVALLRAVDPILVNATQLRLELPRLDEAAFDSTRKRMTTVHSAGEGRYLVAVKGAPEIVAELATSILTPDGPEALDEARRAGITDVAGDYAGRGLRTLALAYRHVDELPDDPKSLEAELTLVAVVGMSDELRPETRGAVLAAEAAGITIVMVTGDHQITATAIGEDLGLLEGRDSMGGTELRALEAEQLAERIHGLAVFARVDPADKVKIVKAWQTHGAIVAMTGDGVNDSPALKTADIGIAMGSGTDVAKESASMVLADDNFATIVSAVEEGRKIFSNLKKVVYFLLSANISEVLVMLFGFLFFGSLGEPLLATQLLWVNLVTDGLPAIGLGMDPAAPGLMKRQPESDRDILGLTHQLRLLWQGAFLASGVLAAYAWGHLVRGEEWQYTRTLALSVLVVAQLLHVYNVRAQATSVWKLGFGGNKVLSIGVIVSLALHLVVVYTPLGQRLFETVAIDPLDWGVVAVLAVIPFLGVDLVKRWVQGRHPDWDSAAD